MFKVQAERCNQCLFSTNKIVSDKRRKQILQECVKTDTHFVCHKGTIKGVEVCCSGFHEAFPSVGQLHRIAAGFKCIELVKVD
jgi:hypothetical protein